LGVVEARGLVKEYVDCRGLFRRVCRRVRALDGLSFSVEGGEVYGLLGPNGSGKTTTVKILSTLLLPDSGDAFVDGFSVVRDPIRVRERIGVMLSVERGFFWKLTGYENLKYFGLLYGLNGRELEERIREVSDLLGLRELGVLERMFEDMSMGMKARLGLARALLKDPRVLLLDEPTLGLDPPSARRIREVLREQVRRGKAVLITTHNMFEAEIVCDRVGFIARGRIVAEGSPRDLKLRVRDRVALVFSLAGESWSLELLADRLRREYGVEASISQGGDQKVLRALAYPEAEGRVIGLVLREAERFNVKIVGFRVEEPSLEDVFIAVTGGEGDSGAS